MCVNPNNTVESFHWENSNTVQRQIETIRNKILDEIDYNNIGEVKIKLIIITTEKR